jgi:hypothetical protein
MNRSEAELMQKRSPPRFLGPVIDVPEVTVAVRRVHLCASQAVRAITEFDDVHRLDRLGEAWPAGPSRHTCIKTIWSVADTFGVRPTADIGRTDLSFMTSSNRRGKPREIGRCWSDMTLLVVRKGCGMRVHFRSIVLRHYELQRHDLSREDVMVRIY